MSRFIGVFRIEPAKDQRSARLLEPLTFDSDLLSLRITVPAGFETDLASVPRLLWNIIPPFGSYGEPAVIHDYLYRTQRGITRKQADDVFLEAMKVHGTPAWQRWTIYSAVRSFGWIAWNRNQKKLESV